jgi:structural maintenance of chromosome 1
MQHTKANSVKPLLTSIELKNFKSFLGQHTIGPFLDLTAILGPNGSGK